jgi:hypothetical protein
MWMARGGDIENEEVEWREVENFMMRVGWENMEWH